jgi:asparagine synthase (glutamine-hydrolysing)
MCGIVGFIQRGSREANRGLVHAMAEAVAHRGPDGEGIWLDENTGVSIGHRRLAILDLTECGAQPVVSQSGRCVLAMNGEIYNHRELRLTHLSSRAFRGSSDAETLVELIDQEGLCAALRLCEGMFALALYDVESRTLFLARDRIGEKPLHYAWSDKTFLFASELKAMRAYPAFDAAIDRNSVASFVRFSHVPAPFTIYENCYKLLPGTILAVSAGQPEKPPDFRPFANESPSSPRAFWSLPESPCIKSNESFDEASRALESILAGVVEQEMCADVPVGAFLSAGIDSTTIVSLMASRSGKPIKTFTIGFESPRFDESRIARSTAQSLGTDHTEVTLTARDVLKILPTITSIYDEPFADSSQIPTFFVSKLAASDVKVVLSGDGGDELFGGYPRYVRADTLWNAARWMPFALAAVVKKLSMLSSRNDSRLGRKLMAIAELINCPDKERFYLRTVSHWRKPHSLVRNAQEHRTFLHRAASSLDETFFEFMMRADLFSYLPNDILVKTDRASMACSLEVRSPFLHPKIVKFAHSLPLNYKIHAGVQKRILRDILRRNLPRFDLRRPKSGFAIPLEEWLRGPLKEWAGDLLNPVAIRNDGFFDEQQISSAWNAHISGRQNWEYHLWDVLMFQSWLHA